MSKSYSKSDNDINDDSFQTFFGTIIVIILLPLLYNIINLFFFYKEEYKSTKDKKYLNCECSICRNRLTTHNKKVYKRNFTKVFYFKLLMTLILSYWAYKCFYEVSEKASKINFKEFDPYETLNVKYREDNIKVIKKAYRKIMISKHPDKLISSNTSAAEADYIRKEFMKAVTAYEILTDPDKKHNFETYGDPEGPKSRMHFVLPTFFFNKQLHLPIIICFLIFIFGLAIYTVLYLKGNDDVDEFGNSRTNQAIYYHNLNENVQLKHIPLIIGLSQEFNSFPLRANEDKDLNELWLMCKPFIPKIKSEQLPLNNKKAIILIYSWLSRIVNIEASLVKDQANMQKEILDILDRLYLFAIKINKAKMYNKRIKAFGYNCIKSLTEFSQCFHQRLWFDYSPYMQFPYLEEVHIINSTKKLRKEFIEFTQFLDLSQEDKTLFIKQINPTLNKEKIDDIIEISSVIPTYNVSVDVYVEDVDDILVKDIVTFKINIERKCLKDISKSDNTEIGFGHSTYLNASFNEKGVVLLCDYEGKLYDDKIIDYDCREKTIIFKFIPSEVSKHIVIYSNLNMLLYFTMLL